MTPDKLREEAPKCGKCGLPITDQRNIRSFGYFIAHQEEDCIRLLQAAHAAALEEVERLKVERDDALTAAKAEASGADKWRQTAHEAERDLQFVERWANHHGVKLNIAAEEVLSVIQHYPPIRAITEGYADGKIPDTPNPWERAERLKGHAEAMAVALDIDGERCSPESQCRVCAILDAYRADKGE